MLSEKNGELQSIEVNLMEIEDDMLKMRQEIDLYCIF